MLRERRALRPEFHPYRNHLKEPREESLKETRTGPRKGLGGNEEPSKEPIKEPETPNVNGEKESRGREPQTLQGTLNSKTAPFKEPNP